MTDGQLLQEYAESRSQEAFARLVERHADWVYSLAIRRLGGDTHLAEDVTQAVFLLMWQKADKLRSSQIVLNAWLFRTAQYACSNALRMKMRRKKHEKRAAALLAKARDDSSESTWLQIAPSLDEMVGHLRSRDRDAILLRFYQRKSMTEIGAVMGISEDAAKKRVARAVDALRQSFARKGITATAGAVAGPILSNITHTAPAKLVALCAVPATTKTAATLGIVKGTIMATLKMKLVTAGVIVGSLTLATGVAVVIVQPWKPNTTSAPQSTPATVSAGGSAGIVQKVDGGMLVRVPATRPRPADQALVIRQRVMCQANLKSIGQALLLYANRHRGAYPHDLGELFTSGSVSAAVFVCPQVGNTPLQTVEWVNNNSDYLYLGPGLTANEAPDMVIVYEKDDNEYGDGMNILFGDGHVEFQQPEAAHAAIQASMAKLAQRDRR